MIGQQATLPGRPAEPRPPAGTGTARPVPAVLRAEAQTILQLAGELTVTSSGIVIDVTLHDCAAVHSVARVLTQVFPAHTLTPDSAVVRIVNGEHIARLAGLLHRGRPTRALPSWILDGPIDLAAAAWRAALLVRSSRPRHRPGLTVVCPDRDTAVAMARLARRLGCRATHSSRRATRHRADIPGTDAATMLTMIGLDHHTVSQHQHRHRAARPHRDHPAAETLRAANARRSARAATATTARVRRALDLLEDTAPEPLLAAGRLRVAHPGLSLTELSRRADPVMTKDCLAGRLRRLLALADKHHPPTASSSPH